MATDNKLRGRVDPPHATRIEQVAEDHDEGRSDAERRVVDEGLKSMGYLERPTSRHELLLWYVRRIGYGLGFIGFAGMGFGTFHARVFALIGFALTLNGFLLVAVSDFLDTYTDTNGVEE